MNFLQLAYSLTILLMFGSGVIALQDEEQLRYNLKKAEPKAKTRAYIQLGEYYVRTTGKGDSAIYYSERIINQFKNTNDLDQIARGYSLKGLGYATNKEFQLAKTQLIKGLNIEKSAMPDSVLAELYTRLGGVYENLNELPLAVENYLSSITYSKRSKSYKYLALSYYGVSVIYAKQKQYNKQLEYLQNALRLLEDEDSIAAYTKSLVLGSASQQFSALSRNPDYTTYQDSSYVYAQKALEYSKQQNLVQRIPSDLIALCLYNINSAMVDEGLELAEEALGYTATMRDDTKLNLFQILAHIHRAKNEKANCYAYLDSLKNLSINDQPYYGSIISKYRHVSYKYFEDHDLAYKALDDYFEFESLKNDVEKNKTINELEVKYNSQLKEAEIKKLTTWLVIVIALALLGFLIFYVLRLKKSKKKNQLLKEAIKQQLAFEKELVSVRHNIAQDFHDDLGNKLARISFLSRLVEDELSEASETIKNRISTVKEDSVSLYVGTKDFIFSLKPDSDYIEEVITYLSDFGEDFFQASPIKFMVKKELKNNVKLPHYWSKQLIFIFKEAMTNVLKHARANKVELSFVYVDKVLNICCKDDGIGFDELPTVLENGIFNMKTRAEKIGGVLEVHSKLNEGTSINFIGEL